MTPSDYRALLKLMCAVCFFFAAVAAGLFFNLQQARHENEKLVISEMTRAMPHTNNPIS